MSKKTTRKGIALTTGLAFGLANLTGAPALAVGDGALATIEPDEGKSMVGVLDSTFELDTYFEDDNYYTGNSVLKIENPSLAEITFDDNDIDDYDVFVMRSGKLVEATENYWSDGEYAYDDAVLYLELDDYSDQLTIGTNEESGSVSLNLTLWGDANLDGVIGDTEKSYGVATNTLKFVDPASLTPRVALSTQGVDTDDNMIWSTVTFLQDVNVAYINEDNWLVTLDNGTTSVDGTSVVDSDTDLRSSSTVYLTDEDGYDTDFNGLWFDLYNYDDDDVDGDAETFVAADKLSARVAYTDDSGDTYKFKGTKSSTYSLAAGDNEDDVTDFTIDADSSVFATDELRAGTKSITYTIQAQDDGVDLEEAGIDAQISIDWLDSDFYDNSWDNSVTIVGTGISTNYDDDVESVLTTQTNSDGQIEFTVAVDDASRTVEYNIEVLFKAGTDSTWSDAIDLNLEYVDAEATAVEASSYVLAGANPTVSVSVEDQFGEAISTDADGKALKVELRDQNDSDLLKSSAPVTKGEAKFTFKNYVETGEVAVLEAVVYAGATSTSTLLELADTINLYNPAATGSVVLDDTSIAVDITYEPFVTGDSTEFDDDTVAPSGDTDTQLEGTVKDINGAPLPAGVVTINGKGLQFNEVGTTEYFKDSITVVSSEDGEFAVNVWAHEYNEDGISITAASGGKSATASLVTDYLADSVDNQETLADNIVVAWNAPSHPAVNKTYIVSTTVTDTWGNVIEDAELDYSAAGSLQVNGDDQANGKKTNASGKSTTYVRSVADADGFAELEVDVIGLTLGEITLDDADLNVTLTKELLVGKDGEAKAGKNAGVVKAYAWNASGKTVQVYVSGKLVANRVATSNKFAFKVKGMKSGAKKVTVKVAGNTFFSELVTIK